MNVTIRETLWKIILGCGIFIFLFGFFTLKPSFFGFYSPELLVGYVVVNFSIIYLKFIELEKRK